jgi:hypothetical protein
MAGMRRGTNVGLVLAMSALGLAGCSPADDDSRSAQATRPAQGGHPASNCAAVDSASATPTPSSPFLPPRPPAAPVVISGFDDYTAVRPCDFPGPAHYGWSSLRFKTSDWIHCDLYDGPGSFQYYSSIRCWGQLPGVPDGANTVTVEPGAVATFDRTDLNKLETHMTGPDFKEVPVDPGSYRELAPGQKIIVPGSRNGSGIDMNDEVCAVADDNSLTCEIQHPPHEDKKTHGFHLSAQGSRVY